MVRSEKKEIRNWFNKIGFRTCGIDRILNQPLVIHVLVLVPSPLIWVESVNMVLYHFCDYAILCYMAKVKRCLQT